MVYFWSFSNASLFLLRSGCKIVVAWYILIHLWLRQQKWRSFYPSLWSLDSFYNALLEHQPPRIVLLIYIRFYLRGLSLCLDYCYFLPLKMRKFFSRKRFSLFMVPKQRLSNLYSNNFVFSIFFRELLINPLSLLVFPKLLLWSSFYSSFLFWCCSDFYHPRFSTGILNWNVHKSKFFYVDFVILFCTLHILIINFWI